MVFARTVSSLTTSHVFAKNSSLSIRRYAVIHSRFGGKKTTKVAATTITAQHLQCRNVGSCDESPSSPTKIRKKTTKEVAQPVPVKVLNGENCTQNQMADALRPNFVSQTPVLLRSSPLSNCDAIKCWRSLEYLKLAVGETTNCEVEIGKGYNDANVMRPEIPFGAYVDYLEQFAISKQQQQQQREEETGELVYLAQNDLNSFPIIGDDIPIPTLCSDPTLNVGEGKLYNTMLWMGPSGTVSPLHYDPLDNLMIQVVGQKRIILYPRTVEDVLKFPKSMQSMMSEDDDNAEEGEKQQQPPQLNWHYAGANKNQYNTSAVDIENIDYEKYPLFVHAPTPYECIISPGDVLYIPQKWWHHVRSLDNEKENDTHFSVSVNAWWR